MEDYKITINKNSKNASLERYIIGNDAENLQANLVFVFDEFVNGQARLEYEFDNKKNWIPLEKVGESYKIPVRSVLTRKGMTRMQLVITQGIDVNEIPIFKSNVFVVYCGESLNVIAEAPEGYNEWLEFANTKLNQMDNINVEAVKVGNKGIITLTRRDGSQDVIEIYDGEKGDKGDKGDTYELTEKDKFDIGNIASSNAESTFKKYYDDKVNDFDTNATNKTSTFDTNASEKTSDFDSNATNKVEAYNSNANTKTKEYNENTIAQIKSFNENATQKASDYDTNHTNKLKEYNDNHNDKMKLYNDNAKEKLDNFNAHVQDYDNAITDLQQQITANNDELNQVVGEVSDVKEQQGLFKQEQTLQNKAIQKNVDDIIETHTRINRNSKRIENVETALYKKGEASGEFINIQDSALSEVKDIKGSINKAQDTTQGYNLFDISKIKNVGAIKNKGNYIEITNSYYNSTGVTLKEVASQLLANQTYNLMFDNDKTASAQLIYLEQSKKQWGNNSSILITQEDLDSTFAIYGSDEKIVNMRYIKITTNENQNKPYEPYTGGIPAPNPNYQREIAKQSGVVEITSCGKNFIDLNDLLNEKNWNNEGNDWTNHYYLIPKIKDNLTISIKVNETANRYISVMKTLKKDSINQNDYTLVNWLIGEYLEGSITFKQDDNYYYYLLTNNLATVKSIIEAQFEIGTEPTPYEPYQAITEKVDLKENVMLPKDDLVRKINPSDNKLWWALKKNSGEENKNNVSSITIPTMKSNGKFYSNVGGTLNDKTIDFGTNITNLNVVYELETPQTIYLQPVQNFNMTYNPITNIFSNRVNLLLDVSYNRDFVYTIKNLQVDKDTLENQLKDLETRVLALENKPATINESEVITNEDIRTK